MKTTYQELIHEIYPAMSNLAGDGKKITNKLQYAGLKNLKVLETHLSAYNKRVEDINIEHAYEKDGVLELAENGGYKYTKGSAKQRLKALEALRGESVKVTFYVPTSLTGLHKIDAYTQMALVGVLWKEDDLLSVMFE